MAGIFTCKKELVLASGSPRRQRFFRELGLYFTTHLADIDESPLPQEPPGDFVNRMAREKAGAVTPHFPSAWIVAADTVVSLGREILGKPDDGRQAHQMLRKLSATTHSVLTGVCLSCEEEQVTEQFSVKTDVTFTELSDEVITRYIKTNEPFDKAGGYGIQGLGAFLVTEIAGSYSNVVGLPLTQTLTLLQRHKIIVPA